MGMFQRLFIFSEALVVSQLQSLLFFFMKRKLPIYDNRTDLIDVENAPYVDSDLFIINKFLARRYQIPFMRSFMDAIIFNRTKRRRFVLIWHRRSGKDFCTLSALVVAAITSKVPQNYVYYFPTERLAKRVLWDGYTNIGLSFLDALCPPEIREGVNKNSGLIRLINGSTISILGCDYTQNLVGTNESGVCMSEFSLLSNGMETWGRISPILRQRDGFAIFIFTPRTMDDCGRQIYDTAKNAIAEGSREWYLQVLGADKTGVFSEEELKSIKVQDGLSEQLFRVEYYCEWHSAAGGAIYLLEMDEASSSKRVHEVLDPIPGYPIFVAGDLGYQCQTVLLLFQVVEGVIHIFDSIEGRGRHISYYLKEIRDKEEHYGIRIDRIFLPHDSKKMYVNSTSTTFQEVLKSKIPTNVLKKEALVDGITRVKGMFGRLTFCKSKCLNLIRALRSYSHSFNENTQTFSSEPRNSWENDYCDALRYLCKGFEYVNFHVKEIDPRKVKCYRESFR